ncbi:MAG: SBBP repeat-containing protein, partial [Acidobacteriota bacterium]
MRDIAKRLVSGRTALRSVMATLLFLPLWLPLRSDDAFVAGKTRPGNQENQAPLIQPVGSRLSGFEEFHFEGASGPVFRTLSGGVQLLLKSDGMDAAFGGSSKGQSVLQMTFLGAREGLQPKGVDRLSGIRNYLTGGEPSRWQNGVVSFARVSYESIYEGIDLEFYLRNGKIEYDFILSPDSPPSNIQFEFAKPAHLELDPQGDLIASVGSEQLRITRPAAFQEIEGQRHAVACSWSLSETQGRVAGFEVGVYDAEYPLIIDPVLERSTYFGGAKGDVINAIEVDSQGFIYIAGSTESFDLPGAETIGDFSGNLDVLITKLAPGGREVVFTTIIGGSGNDSAEALQVSSSGEMHVVGTTTSADFPLSGAVQEEQAGSTDVFVLRLDRTGNRLSTSTFIGGARDDTPTALAVAKDGRIYVGGYTRSEDFPVVNAIQKT